MIAALTLTTVLAGIAGAAVLVTSLGIIYAKLLKPFLKELRWREELLPVVTEMAKQFRTDSGSSLRDEINVISAAVVQIKEAADVAHAAATLVSQNVAATSAEQRTAQETFGRIERLLTEIRDQPTQAARDPLTEQGGDRLRGTGTTPPANEQVVP